MADTPPKAPKSKRNRMILIGVAGAALLLFLYMRSQSSGSSTNATSAADLQNAYAQGQQAAASGGSGYSSSPYSSFADNGANAAALGTALTTGLQQVDTDLQNLPSQINAAQGGSGATTSGSTTPPAPAPTVTVNVSPVDSSVGTGTNAAPNTSTTSFASVNKPLLAPGATAPNYRLVRPSTAPTSARWAGAAKPSGNWKGIGGGWWVPAKK